MISADKKITSQTAALADLGIDTGDFTIDGVTLSLDADDTINDLRLKINNAVDADGKKLGVTASVLKMADDNFRLVLSAKESGSEGVTYQDVGTDTVLQNLGIIQNASGDKGTTKQTLLTTDAIAQFDALAVGETVTISGVDRFGQAVQHNFVKKTGATYEDLTKEISEAFNGLVDIRAYDPANPGSTSPTTLEITDKIGGSSFLSISSITFGTTAPTSATVTTSQFGDEGSGVLSTGKDAWFSIENMTMNSSTNKATGVVNGVTFEFKGVTKKEDASVSLSITRDLDGIKKKFQDIVDSYNALLRFKKDATKIADPKDENSKNGDLAGDSTVSSIINQIRTGFRQNFDFENTPYTNFTMVGLKTDAQSGEFQIDNEKFRKAIETDLDSVIKMFTTSSSSPNKSVTLGRSTKDTTAGSYVVEELDSSHFRIRLEGSSEWTTSESRIGDVITFSEGPAKGLSLEAVAGSIGNGLTTQFTLTKGLSTVLEESINKLNDSHDGLIAMRQESLRKSVEYADDKISTLEDRIERYRLRLVKQFSDMEKAMSTMQSQSTNMVNSLSSFNKND
ncbi:MAG TPA: flagellar filament capping protein FliD [Chitinispirillaceae bacterium]|nr:flagellar filament capping protein FliD [Chitinispirillaceae bacterium]